MSRPTKNALKMASVEDESDGFDWAIPLIEEAEREFARGEGIPLAEVELKIFLSKKVSRLECLPNVPATILAVYVSLAVVIE